MFKRSPDQELRRLERAYATTGDYKILLRLRHYADLGNVCLHERARCFHKYLTGMMPRDTVCPECNGSGQSWVSGNYDYIPDALVDCYTCGGYSTVASQYVSRWYRICTDCNEILKQEDIVAESGYNPTQPDWCSDKKARVLCRCGRELAISERASDYEDGWCSCGLWNSRIPGYCTRSWGCRNLPSWSCNKCGEAICIECNLGEIPSDDDHLCER